MAARPEGLGGSGPEPTVDDLRHEQWDEARHTTFVHTRGQAHGLLFGGLVFGVAGLVLGGLIGLVAFDADSPARIVVPIIVAVFTSWVGVVYFGGRTPELEHETVDIHGRPEDGTSPRNPDIDDNPR